MEKIAVIDTETTWSNRVMSIGAVVARADNFQAVDAKYQILTPEYLQGGMFSGALFCDARLTPQIASREQALEQLRTWLARHGVTALFAYNAGFDKGHLPELRDMKWYDILRLAAYRQYNPQIPWDAECFSTGRLKRGYGVEPVLRMLSRDRCYRETHNALLDAMDELRIMRLLGHKVEQYIEI